MNRKILIVFSILLSLLFAAVHIAMLWHVNASVVKDVDSELRLRLSDELTLVTASVREDLLFGNIRGARNRLASLAKSSVFNDYEIRRDADLVEPRKMTESLQEFTVTKPVQFQDGGKQWGTITFFASSATVDQVEQKLDHHLHLTAFLLTAAALALFGFVFGLLWAVGEQLRPLLVEILEGRTGYRISSPAARAFWRPLLTAFDRTSTVIEAGKRNEAIARMTGMLAHDVRKPFSILRMGLGMLGNAKDPAGVKRILGKLIPEIDKAVGSVDGLIADVMEVGSTSEQLIQEPASPESLVEAALGEAFRIYPKADISVSYKFEHIHMVDVHVQKVGRVFSNIVGNAVQAMGPKGQIWFRTREHGQFIEFCLGNAGSVIPTENLPKLFDAFFTSGKKGGTGLGLAIAQKVVNAHGGKIWCESSKTAEHPEGQVEFLFELPVAIGHVNTTTAQLPKHSSEIAKAILNIEETNESLSIDRSEVVLEGDIGQASADLKRPLAVLVIDDEAIYRKALTAYLSRTPELSSAVEIIEANGSSQALTLIGNHEFDLIITDVDLGAGSLDGFQLVSELRRKQKLSSLICVHSNRIVAADHQTATSSGADAFLPKPMARAQLLRLTLQAAQKAADAMVLQSAKTMVTISKPEVLVVDDNPFVLDAWEDALKADVKVHLADSLEAIKALLAADPQVIERLELVITDLHFDNSSSDGFAVGRWLKALRESLPILLSSDAVVTEEELAGTITNVIAKDPVSFSKLPKA